MKIFLDDVRSTPVGWQRAYSVEEAIALVMGSPSAIEEMSLDHDLGMEPPCQECNSGLNACDMSDSCHCGCHNRLRKTGYEFVKWMCETGNWPTIKPWTHSDNPVGRANMQALIERYWCPPGSGGCGGGGILSGWSSYSSL